MEDFVDICTPLKQFTEATLAPEVGHSLHARRSPSDLHPSPSTAGGREMYLATFVGCSVICGMALIGFPSVCPRILSLAERIVSLGRSHLPAFGLCKATVQTPFDSI